MLPTYECCWARKPGQRASACLLYVKGVALAGLSWSHSMPCAQCRTASRIMVVEPSKQGAQARHLGVSQPTAHQAQTPPSRHSPAADSARQQAVSHALLMQAPLSPWLALACVLQPPCGWTGARRHHLPVAAFLMVHVEPAVRGSAVGCRGSCSVAVKLGAGGGQPTAWAMRLAAWTRPWCARACS